LDVSDPETLKKPKVYQERIGFLNVSDPEMLKKHNVPLKKKIRTYNNT